MVGLLFAAVSIGTAAFGSSLAAPEMSSHQRIELGESADVDGLFRVSSAVDAHSNPEGPAVIVSVTNLDDEAVETSVIAVESAQYGVELHRVNPTMELLSTHAWASWSLTADELPSATVRLPGGDVVVIAADN